MSLDILGDLDIFLNLSEFAKLATIDPSGTPRTVKVIFDTADYSVDSHERGAANIASSKPVMTGKTSDMASLAQGTIVQISGINYRTHRSGPDEDGLMKWELHKL